MVLLSVLSGFAREPIRFGERDITERNIQEQGVLAAALFVPALLIGHLSLRLSVRPPFFVGGASRADLWNAFLRILVADMIMEAILPSLQCIPLEDEETLYEWTVQSLGVSECPLYVQLMTPQAQGIIFAMRMLAICIGIYLGEGFCPIALTGGIASGKSTVAQQLVNGMSTSNNDDTTTNTDQKDDKKTPDETNTTTTKKDKKQEEDNLIDLGTVYLVDTDQIAHDILLSTSSGSVYKKVVKAFGEEDIFVDDNDNDDDKKEASTSTKKEIDRSKLGSIVFADQTKRRRLNQITHPRIVSIMMQKMLYGLFVSWQHLTIVDIPLFYESPWFIRSLFCLTTVVYCTPEQQLERLELRSTDNNNKSDNNKNDTKNSLTKQECLDRIQSQLPLDTKKKYANIVVDNTESELNLALQTETLRQDLMNRVYGVGLSVFQMVVLLGMVIPLTVFYKMYLEQRAADAAPPREQ